MNRYLLPAILLTGLITLGTAISAAYVVMMPEPKVRIIAHPGPPAASKARAMTPALED